MKIAQNKKASAGIIMPETPTPREVFAAEELISYIEKISGVRLSVSDEYENKIIIGGPERNSAAEELISREEFKNLVSGPEGFMIKATRNYLIIAGSSNNEGEQERGTIYGVYEFLERFLDASLSAYGKGGTQTGEYVPENENIEIPDETYVKKCADIEYRTAIIQHSAWVGNPNHKLNTSYMSWLSKNRYNRILTWTGIYEGYKENGTLEEAAKRGIMFSVGHHQAINMLLLYHGSKDFPEKYGEIHPEFYKLQPDGTRYEVKEGNYNGQLILCMRNEEVIKTMAENIINWSDKNPQVDVICLWPHDGRDEQCCCDKCSKYSKSENYSFFVDRIIEKVALVKPHIKIDRIAYLDLLECDGKKISENIIIDEAVWHSTLRGVGKPDGGCFKDSDFEKNILRWKKTGAKVVYYDYLMGIYSCKQKWLPCADEMQAVCQRFKELGIYGLGSQMECYNLWNNIFNFYSYGRTAYDTELSMEDNLERFCRIFGEGAPFIKEIIRTGEDIVDGQLPLSKMTPYLMEHIDKEKIYSLYEKAFEGAKTPLCRNNIRLMRMAWRYTDLELSETPIVDESIPAYISTVPDKTGELWYMYKNFDSFISGNEGFGISIPVSTQSEVAFEPNYWYMFE